MSDRTPPPLLRIYGQRRRRVPDTRECHKNGCVRVVHGSAGGAVDGEGGQVPCGPGPRHFQAECTGWPDGSGGWCVRRAAEFLRRAARAVGLANVLGKAVGLKRRARELSDTQFAIGMAESSAPGALAVHYELMGLYWQLGGFS